MIGGGSLEQRWAMHINEDGSSSYIGSKKRRISWEDITQLPWFVRIYYSVSFFYILFSFSRALGDRLHIGILYCVSVFQYPSSSPPRPTHVQSTSISNRPCQTLPASSMLINFCHQNRLNSSAVHPSTATLPFSCHTTRTSRVPFLQKKSLYHHLTTLTMGVCSFKMERYSTLQIAVGLL